MPGRTNTLDLMPIAPNHVRPQAIHVRAIRFFEAPVDDVDMMSYARFPRAAEMSEEECACGATPAESWIYFARLELCAPWCACIKSVVRLGTLYSGAARRAAQNSSPAPPESPSRARAAARACRLLPLPCRPRLRAGRIGPPAPPLLDAPPSAHCGEGRRVAPAQNCAPQAPKFSCSSFLEAACGVQRAE